MIKIKLASAKSEINRLISGLWKGFRDNDVDATVWYMDAKPAFDLFYEEKFDVLVIEEENLEHNKALLKCLNKVEDIRIILKLKDNDLPNLDLPLQIGSPYLYFISTNEYLPVSSDRTDIHLIRYAADFDFFKPSLYVEKEENSIVYIGRPSKYVNGVLSKLCNPPGKFNIKLFTTYDCADDDVFPFIQYCGKLKFEQESQIYQSAMWCLDIAEEGQNYISQKCYEILACDGNLLTNNKLVNNITENYGLTEDFSQFHLFPNNIYQGDENSKDLVRFDFKDRAKQILDLL